MHQESKIHLIPSIGVNEGVHKVGSVWNPGCPLRILPVAPWKQIICVSQVRAVSRMGRRKGFMGGDLNWALKDGLYWKRQFL